MSANENLTIKDIARACGVGLGTVSRAINGTIFQHPENLKHLNRQDRNIQ